MVAGAVVYFGDIRYYGSGGTATQERNAAGFRLLAVDPAMRGKGIGKLLTLECIRKAKDKKQEQLIIHTTMAMQTAWKMYETIGFKRSQDLDFMQQELAVFGFRLKL
jgi:GNAT superfamily N-acetyltransferase